MERYLRLPKAKTIVPSWRTLAVLKRKKKSCAVHPDGIHYGTHDGKPIVYWHPGLAQFIRPQKPYEKVQVYAFDEPFNRSLAIVYGQVYVTVTGICRKIGMRSIQVDDTAIPLADVFSIETTKTVDGRNIFDTDWEVDAP